jgi:hypothetical protein
VLPLSDGLPARRVPVANISLIVANFAVWLLYELPDLNSAVFHSSFYPCTVDGACQGPEPWGVSWMPSGRYGTSACTSPADSPRC